MAMIGDPPRLSAHPSCPDCRCVPEPQCSACHGMGFVIESESVSFGVDPFGNETGSTSISTKACPNGCQVMRF